MFSEVSYPQLSIMSPGHSSSIVGTMKVRFDSEQQVTSAKTLPNEIFGQLRFRLAGIDRSGPRILTSGEATKLILSSPDNVSRMDPPARVSVPGGKLSHSWGGPLGLLGNLLIEVLLDDSEDISSVSVVSL